ncbi:MAG: hypothetical protein WAZ19_01865, partial [Anaerolineae bacterium]
GWEGRGSVAFFTEMQSEIMPALQRLGAALRQGQQVSGQLSRLLCQAEEKAAEPFRGARASSTYNPGSTPLPSASGARASLSSVAGAMKGFGSGLWYATVFQNKPDFVGNARLGFKPPRGRWLRSFHLDGPHGNIPYPHFNAEIGPLRGLDHMRIPAWAQRLGSTSLLKGVGRATLILGLAIDTYTVVTASEDQRGGAIGGVVGGWGGALAGAAIGSAICPGIGTVIGGLIGGFAGGWAGEWAGGQLIDQVSV